MKKLISTFVLLLTAGAVFAQCNASFTWAAAPSGTNLLRVGYTNTTIFTPPVPQAYVSYNINYGDNTTGYMGNGTIYHNYSAPGTYTVVMGMFVYDSLTSNVICSDFDTQTVNVAYTPCGTTISAVQTSLGTYTFTATTPAGTAGMVYNWDFGDGGTGTGSPVAHTYVAAGVYTVILTAAGGGCTYTATYTAQTSGSNPCNGLYAAFNASTNNLLVTVSNTSTQNYQLTRAAHWDFGDGSATVNNINYTSHTYAAAGSYLIHLINDWKDSATQAVVCSDTVSQLITVAITPQPNLISGYIIWDSLNTAPNNVSFKVWLIKHDSAANTLIAIDSTTASGASFAQYTFQGAAPGSYLTKAAPIYNSPAVSGLVPTYHDSSIYWSNAAIITHAGGNTANKYIWMKTGIATSGPGFIGGNISLGANKGTAAGVPNQLVFLRDAANNMIRFTYTDLNGDYSFGNIPTGNYTIYPEDMNYITIPSSNLSIIAGQATITNIDFKKTPTHIKPINGTTGINNLPLLSDEYLMYPNPANNTLSVYMKGSFKGSANIDIITITGAKALSVASVPSKETIIDLSSLQSGMYIVRITAGSEQHIEKLFVQH